MARQTLSNRPATLEEAPPRAVSGRRVAVVLTALAVLLALIVVGIVSSGARPALAQLRVRDGRVDIDHGGKGFVRASDGVDVKAGDAIKTARGGQGVVSYFDGSVTRFDQDSRIDVRTLSDARDAHRIELALGGGRVWNHVLDLTETGDRFTLGVSNVTVSVRGATFDTDCRNAEGCYVVVFDGSAHLTSTGGEEADVPANGCESIAQDGSLDACNATSLGLIDGWVRANLAEDQLLVTATTPAPSPSPTEEATTPTGSTSSGGGTRARRPVSRPVQTPSKTAPPSTPAPTVDHNHDGEFPTPPPSPSHGPKGSPKV